jgi:hypothetical protein
LILVVGGLLATAARGEMLPLPDDGIGDFPRPQAIRVLIGDIDGFHPGDPLDAPILSADCCDILCYCEGQPGMCERDCLDEYGDDRPVGLTAPFYVPDGARILSAELTFSFLAVSQYACNDFFLTTPNEYPAIALRDVVGCEPDVGKAYVGTIDLTAVPTRTSGMPAPDGHWSGPPDTVTDLVRAMRRKGRLDLALGDDVSLDYAELRIVWEFPTPPPNWNGGKVPILISPNPGGGDATMSFSLARRAMAVVEVFDVSGRRVAVPARAMMGPGPLRVTWNGRTVTGAPVAPGTYFVRLSAGEETGTAKLLRIQ